MGTPIHVRPTADLAERVLLPGDPGRALRLAQELLHEPKMFNHNRGLWGYTGAADVDGEALTIQSTGIGGPSAAIVVHELAELGARRFLRVGTCGGFAPGLELGQLLIATEAIAADGTSRALGAGERVPASEPLLAALRATASGAGSGTVVSTDLFYDGDGHVSQWLAAGALAVEMETAALFALAAAGGFEAGALLIVSDLLLPERVRLDEPALHAAELRLGTAAVQALAALRRAA